MADVAPDRYGHINRAEDLKHFCSKIGLLAVEMLSYFMDDRTMREMIADYMEKGFLENIIDMFKHDSNLYYLIGDLMRDERIRVRLGIAALVEALSVEDRENIKKALPGLIRNLNDKDPRIRGDMAYLLGIISNDESLPHLMKLLNDDDRNVREIAKESIAEISGKTSFD